MPRFSAFRRTKRAVLLAGWIFALGTYAKPTGSDLPSGFCRNLLVSEPSLYDPGVYVREKAAGWLTKLQEGREAAFPRGLSVQLERPTSTAFSSWLFEHKLVEASEFSLLMSDKLFAANLLREALGDEFKNFHPPVSGLKEFFVKHGFTGPDGSITAGPEEILAGLRADFPNGFVVKPTTGLSSGGAGFVITEEEFLRRFYAQKRGLTIKNFAQPDGSPLEDGKVLSGELWFIMGKIGKAAFMNAGAASSKRLELRLHSLWGNLIPDGTVNRFYLIYDHEKGRAAEKMVSRLLRLLPPQVTQHQAWSFDVMVDDNNAARIAEINSNRGQYRAWSGFFSMPDVVRAYAKFLAARFGWKFEGENAQALIAGAGNIKPYFKGELERWAPDSSGSDADRAVVLEELEEFYHLYIPRLARQPREVQETEPFRMAFQIGAEIEDMLTLLKSGDPQAWRKFRTWAEWWINE